MNSPVGDALPFTPPGFEKELPKPFAESFELLGRYAEDIAARLRAQDAASPGFVVTIHKETNPRFLCWELSSIVGCSQGRGSLFDLRPEWLIGPL